MWLETKKARNFNAVVWVLGEVNGYHASSHAGLPSLSDRPGNRLVGKAQLVAGTPFRADIVDQDGLAHALDGALGESVPRVGAGNEHHAGIKDTGGTAHQVLLFVQQIRTPFLRAAFLREIDLQGQLLDTDVGVRPEPDEMDPNGETAGVAG